MYENNPLRGVITDRMLAELRERNHYRQQAAIAEMGTRWICDPSQHVQRTSPKPLYLVAARIR